MPRIPSLTDLIIARINNDHRGGNDERALRLARFYSRLHKHQAYVWLHRAQLESSVNGKDSEELILREALRNNPNSAEISAALAFCLSLRGSGDAEAAFQEALSRNPNAGLPYVFLASHLAKQRQWNMVEANARRAADLLAYGDRYGWLMLAGVAIFLPGAHSFAEEVTAHLIRIGRKEPKGHLLMAALMVDKAPSEARKHLEACRRIWRSARPIESDYEQLVAIVRQAASGS